MFFFVDNNALLTIKGFRDELERLKKALKESFEMHEKGYLGWFLGVRILRDREKKKISLVQDSYISRMVNRFEYLGKPRATVPITHVPEPNKSPVNNTNERRLNI